MQVIAIYRYMTHETISSRMQTTRRRLATQLDGVARVVHDLRFVLEVFDEFDTDYWQTAATWARTWVSNWIITATAEYQRLIREGHPPANAQRVYNELALLFDALDHIQPQPPR